MQEQTPAGSEPASSFPGGGPTPVAPADSAVPAGIPPEGGESPPGATAEESRKEMIEHPAKVLRIGGLIREMLEEVRRDTLDEEGRRRARSIYENAVEQLKEGLSPDLRVELERLVLPFPTEVPTQAELRVSQAQLVGWFEGLFHGMQAILFGQRPGMPGMGPQPPGPGGPAQEPRIPGQYL